MTTAVSPAVQGKGQAEGAEKFASFVRHPLDGRAGFRLAADDVEVVPVEAEVVPEVVGEPFDLRVVLGADDRVDVQAEAAAEAILQRVERADAGERLLPVAGH